MIASWEEKELSDFLTHTCEVWEPSSLGTDRGGLPALDWEVVTGETERACFIEPIDKAEIESGDAQILRADYRLFAGSDLALTQTHQIRNWNKNGEGETGDEKVYEIVKVDYFPRLDNRGLGAHIEAYLVEIL